MSDFSVNIDTFIKYGTYEYKFDSSGNLIFNSSSNDFSQNFLSFPLSNFSYNKSKIETFYDVKFKEFIPVLTSSPINNEEIQQKLDAAIEENKTLSEKLDTLISQSDSNTTEAEKMATKQVILELRKQLGQGRTDSDFSEDFPYTPVIKNV
jgi:hypothetical protein